MSNDAVLLERLDRIEQRLERMASSAESSHDLHETLAPILKGAFVSTVAEFNTLDHKVNLDDLFALFRRVMFSVRDITYVLDQLENIIELWRTVEPMTKPLFLSSVEAVDRMERKGTFEKLSALGEIGSRTAESFSAEQIRNMGETLVFFLTVLERMSNPETRAMLEKLVGAISDVDPASVKGVGIIGMAKAMGSKEMQDGLGVALEMVKALGKIKE